MPSSLTSKAGVVNLGILDVEHAQIWNKIQAEYAKGDAADTKKLEKWARQLTVIFHSSDASTQQMEQRDLAEALNTTNEELVRKNKNFFAQCLEGTSGGIGIVTAFFVVNIIVKTAMGGQAFDAIAGFIDVIGKFGPMVTGGIDGIAKASRAGDEAARLSVDHKMKSLTSNRNDGQGRHQTATGELSQGLRHLKEAHDAEAAQWSAASAALR